MEVLIHLYRPPLAVDPKGVDPEHPLVKRLIVSQGAWSTLIH
jgi:hypothetical protein